MIGSHHLPRLIFAGTTILLFFLAYMFYRQVEELLASYKKVNESNIVKLKLEQTVSALKDAETAQRGYLLTNDSLFLQPFFGSYETSMRLMKEIREETNENTLQQRDLNSLLTFIEVRYRTFDNVIRQYKRSELSNDIRKIHLLRGIASMDSIRNYVQRIRIAEDNKISYREKEKHKYSLLTPFLGFLIIIVGLGIMLFSYLRIMKNLGTSNKMLRQVKELNQELTQKNYQLELYNKELDSFTYVASHDLKEPLRKILTFNSLIEQKESDRLSAEGIQNFQRIRKAAGRMQLLLNDLLNYSQVTIADRDFEKVDMNYIIQQIKEKLTDELREADAFIQCGQLPRISGLGFQLQQLFENLANNAITFRKTDMPLEIRISSSLERIPADAAQPLLQNKWYHRIVVEDNGKGFEPAYAEKMFQLFQRSNSANNESTGIGLTICKKIVQNHNGFIRAKGEVDKGARFEVYFPV